LSRLFSCLLTSIENAQIYEILREKLEDGIQKTILRIRKRSDEKKRRKYHFEKPY